MFVKALPLFIALGFFIGKGPAPADFEYIGSAKCKSCHNKATTGAQYKLWAAGPHANALAKLSAEEQKDPKCLKCHATVGHTDVKLQYSLTKKEGIGCESCHGPGSAYKSMSVMKSREKSVAKGLIIPDEKLCKTCHNEESPDFKGFNYEEYLKQMAHPNPDK
ncbi:MAG: cytochrome C554 [Bacteroidetes bacterium]|jgi:hypothetical protein|nr:cytochrome C554 [Bacteroidota bacterium]MBT3750191.1 cytochrome C554 [Bacteroidota bacterium]MBT4400743.1 cytochrome C554 [Bacteroidota bacterium]MBT4411018.1 cytochrome C554 [Bacteroidota bacterium]MBT7095532.1 cytochrome C554 [Bacteroidota bacterium]